MKPESMAITVNILLKRQDELYVAHCLELDIVAAASTANQAQSEIAELIIAQIHYAFSNDNLDHLFRPAPPEVWKEFNECRERSQEKYQVTSPDDTEEDLENFVPPWVIANTCQPSEFCHA